MHLGTEKSSSKHIALKIVRQEGNADLSHGPHAPQTVMYRSIIRAMQQELQFVRMLGNHPNIVKVLGTSDGGKIIAMELAVSDLYMLIQHTSVPMNLCVRWTQDVLRAVEFMHSMDVIHQDLKSSNILIFADKAAKVGDFGISHPPPHLRPPNTHT